MLFVSLILVICTQLFFCFCFLITTPGSKNNNDKTKERKTQIKRKRYRSFSKLQRPHPRTVGMSVEGTAKIEIAERHCWFYT